MAAAAARPTRSAWRRRRRATTAGRWAAAGTLKGCGEWCKLLDRVATLRRLCDARDASLDAKEATLNAREAELGVEVERLREGEAGLLADLSRSSSASASGSPSSSRRCSTAAASTGGTEMSL